MPFQESAESIKAKLHVSAVKTPVLVGICVLVLVVFFLVFQGIWNFVSADSFAIYYEENSASQENTGSNGAVKTGEEKKVIFVHIGGAVLNPGVYELEQGARVHAAIEAAGGFCEDACPETVNLARLLFDGEQIIILTKEEAELSEAGQVGSVQGKGKVNINRAGLAELTTLPGIGEATAKKIIADREANGPYVKLEDLMRVSGIGEKKFADLAAFITL